MKVVFGLLAALLLIISLASPTRADLRQLFIATSYGDGNPQNNKIFRVPFEGADAGQLIEFAGLGDGIEAPYAIAIHPTTHRLYVANNDTLKILEIEINGDGTKGEVKKFADFPHGFSSMAIRPSTGRIYIGVQGGARANRGLYRMAADGSDYEKIFEESIDQAFFYDDCWIDFDPSNDGIIYVTTGFDNQVRMFSVGGADLGTLSSYGDIRIPTDQLLLPHNEGYWLPHQCFIPAGGGDYHLLVNVHYVPENQNAQQQKRLLLFDPDLNSFLGELPLAGPSLILPNRVLGMVHDDVTGKLYSGDSGYGSVHEIAADYSSCEVLFTVGSSHTRVQMSYGHSTDGDATLEPVQNYINVQARPDGVNPGDVVTLSWNCDFSRWDYRGTPVNVYIAAVQTPLSPDSPSSLDEALGGGTTYLFGANMNSVYTGAVQEPTFSNVVFPPAPTSGSLDIKAPGGPGFSGNYLFAAVFIRLDTATFVRTDALPVENSNTFSIR